MSERLLKSVIPTHRVKEGGGFWVRRPAAMGSLMSPFLLLDEMGPANYGPGEAVGAPWHLRGGDAMAPKALLACDPGPPAVRISATTVAVAVRRADEAVV